MFSSQLPPHPIPIHPSTHPHRPKPPPTLHHSPYSPYLSYILRLFYHFLFEAELSFQIQDPKNVCLSLTHSCSGTVVLRWPDWPIIREDDLPSPEDGAVSLWNGLGGGVGGQGSMTSLPAALLHSVESTRPQKLPVLGLAE